MKRAELDCTTPPGQVNNMEQLDEFAYPSKRGTLGEYIDKTLKHEAMLDRQAAPKKKKLSFDEWWNINASSLPYWWQVNSVPAKEIWVAAQENV